MDKVKHTATVIEVHKNGVAVRIEQMPACATCDAAKSCGIHKGKQKTFQVAYKNADKHFKTGDRVDVFTTLNTAKKAVFTAFILPLILFVATLFVAKQTSGNNETIAIISGFVVLVCYYTLIYIMRAKMNKTFSLHIEQQNKSI